MTDTLAKLPLFRVLIIVAFPTMALLPLVLNEVTTINSWKMTAASCVFTIFLGMILGSGLLFLKALSNFFWFRLLFILCISGLVFIHLEILISSPHAILAFFGLNNVARPLADIILLGAAGLLIILPLIGVMWCYEDQVIDALTILFAVAGFSTILFSGQASRYERPGASESYAQASGLGNLSIYIVVDGMIGSAGLRTDIPQNIELAEEIDAFYRQYGFLHYPRAFSRHLLTRQSIPAILNGLSKGIPDVSELQTTENNRTRLVGNKLFDSLRSRELPIHVYQSTYLNVCSHEAVVSCDTNVTSDRLSSHIPPDFLISPRLAVGYITLERSLSRSRLARKVIVEPLSGLFRAILLKYAPRQYDLLINFDKNTDLTFDSRFDQFSADITSGKGGAYYGHFIVPHLPFRLNSQCKPLMERFLAEDKRYYQRLVEEHGLSPNQAEQKREEFYGYYRDQVRCVYRKLSELFDELMQQGRFDDAVITLMGDHGSRLSNAFFQNLTSDRDLIDNYSTLFAVKQVNSVSQRDLRRISVQQLLMAHQGRDKVEVTEEIEQTIVIKKFGADGTKADTIVDMPDF